MSSIKLSPDMNDYKIKTTTGVLVESTPIYMDVVEKTIDDIRKMIRKDKVDTDKILEKCERATLMIFKCREEHAQLREEMLEAGEGGWLRSFSR
ncbi:hypothetical protein [Entomobacter blattae]|uniref:Uncharacterized protein n=1 Tax=Entomobacter blattae TaxID=2762277 RepID=A0A7H1NUF7_9PROT|nr:hypothetical protein [Entomobacter blattae]QNT79417.1 hypothetical protein JGUZn3_22160 [Entomobacter blattae]